MYNNVTFFKTIFLFLFGFLFKHSRGQKALQRTKSNNLLHQYHNKKYSRFTSLAKREDLETKTLVFNVEGTLLNSSSLFPYFMLVAFEAGSILRALVLLLIYPLIRFLGEDGLGLNLVVAISFFGVKKEKFSVGRAVLPKFLLEDVGFEAFEVVKKGGTKVGVSEKLPQVMIESFLKDYLEIDFVVGRQLKVFCGYFIGLMEDKKNDLVALGKILGDMKMVHSDNVIGISPFKRSFDTSFSHCKEIYLIRKGDKRNWQNLPRDKYPKPLIFHDGRLALRPTPLVTLSLLMWFPLGIVLSLIRVIIGINLPYNISIPILAFSGLRVRVVKPKGPQISLVKKQDKKGLLFVCNHRTLLDPLYLSFIFKKNFTAVTYSLSRLSEILSPIKTVRLTRDRGQDAKMMEKLLDEGDIVVCPEGTTCRKPYLLRFSPLFLEMSDCMVPVALNTHVTMFHGTTAGGLKCLDPLFFLLNPFPTYTARVLESVPGLSRCHDGDGQKSRFEVANHVQSEIGKALGFECIKLTRKDKYLVLAGNEGIVATSSKGP